MPGKACDKGRGVHPKNTMGSGDGRPGTPGPRDGGGAEEGKATYSGAVVLVGIISFVLGVIAVAVPYWGLFRPHTGKHNTILLSH